MKFPGFPKIVGVVCMYASPMRGQVLLLEGLSELFGSILRNVARRTRLVVHLIATYGCMYCLIVIVLDVGRNQYGIEICCASSSYLCLIVMPLNSFCSHDFPSAGCLINQVWRFAQSVARTFSSPAIVTKYLVQTIVHA